MTLLSLTLTFDPIAAVVGAAAVLGAVVYLTRVGIRVVRWCRAMWTVVDQELTHNHGSSMKDDVVGIAIAVGELQRNVEALSRDLYTHLAGKASKSP